MPSLLTASSTMMCPHGGTVAATPGSTKSRAGDPILRQSDTFTVAGCPFILPPSTPHPCVTVQWQQTALKVKHGGDLVLNQSSVGLCLAADQAPQGTVVISSAAPKVSGL